MKNKNIIRAICLPFFLLILHSCSVNKAKIDNDLKQYFDSKNLEGCFTMLNNSNGEITVYNMGLDTSRYLPGATFKIVNALIALQMGVVTDTGMIIKKNNSDASSEKGNNINEAFQIDGTPFFHEVAKRIGRESMQTWIDSLSYGNKNIKGPIDSFWFNNNLKISPDEQLGLLKKLYFDQLPFRKSVQQSVREMMVQEDNSAYKLSYRTGFGKSEKDEQIGWVIGWVEENKHVYFFVTMIKSKDPKADIKKTRVDVTKDILSHYDFFKGKK